MKNFKKWGVFEEDDSVHVIPIDDFEEHDCSFMCKCNPVVEICDLEAMVPYNKILVIHQAFDGRDVMEVLCDENRREEFWYSVTGGRNG